MILSTLMATPAIPTTTAACCNHDCNEGATCPLRAARTAAVATATGRTCDELGVCQSATQSCHSFAQCERKTRYYFAPGTINGGSSSLAVDDGGGWVDLRWSDLLGAMVVLVILGLICGWIG